MVVFRLPDQLQRVASALDDAFPREAVYIHVDSRATEAGVEGFASNGRVWIANGAFRPDTMAGLQLIGHELAHLAQQKRAGTSGLGALEVVDDPALEAAADCFGAAFAASSLFGASWLQAADVAAPCGPVQCAFWNKKSDKQMALQLIHCQYAEDDLDNELFTNSRSCKDNSHPVLKGVTSVYSAANTVTSVINYASYVPAAAKLLPIAGKVVSTALPVTGPLSYAFMALDAYVAHRSHSSTLVHIANLERILSLSKYNKAARSGTVSAIEFTIMKKYLKADAKDWQRKALGFISTLKTAPEGYRKWKEGSLGQDRSIHSSILWGNMQMGCPVAREACKELLGIALYTSLLRNRDGYLVLKEAMKSK